MKGDPSTPASSVSTTDELPLVERFQALVSVAESITSCREPEELFRRLAAELERVVRFDFVAFVLHDPERGVVRGISSMPGAWRSRPDRKRFWRTRRRAGWSRRSSRSLPKG